MQPSTPKNKLGTLQLAWLGDAVWELHQRLKYCDKPAKTKDLHDAVVEEVNASAQAEALAKLEPNLLKSEKDLTRKARNNSGKGPKNTNPATYASATGFEALVGSLFINNPERLITLFKLLD